MMSRTRWLWGIVSAVAIGAAAFFFVIPEIVARTMNGVRQAPPYSVDETIAALHEDLTIADLHADTLLWRRDPARRVNYGHVDLPRLRAAGVTLQVFSAVTKTPRGLNFERNSADSDNITALVIAQRWPTATWTDLTERALHQAERLRQLEDKAAGTFMIVRNQSDLARLTTQRARGSVVGGLLAIEGLHALGGNQENLYRLHAAGYRMMGLTHFFDNAVGGSAHGEAKGGLTPFGLTVLGEMERLGVVVDLAHASPALIDDVLSNATRPVVVSHTGVKGTCDRTRNLSDAQLQAVAANGGLVGIAFFAEAVCGKDVAAIATAIRYTAALIGVEHVALGSDFDGAVTTPFDVTGLPLLWAALKDSGMDSGSISRIAGGNLMRFLQRALAEE